MFIVNVGDMFATTNISISQVNRDVEGHCTDQFFTQLFQFYLGDGTNNSSSNVQSIEIVSRSPAGPPTPPEHFKGRFNFTWDLRSKCEEWIDDGHYIIIYDDEFLLRGKVVDYVHYHSPRDFFNIDIQASRNPQLVSRLMIGYEYYGVIKVP
ncbi:hypothetical protein SAMD00019534_097180 [Acytostelium subglobosum LB1]|uniref:hypothetical protein n=1 Tax=Acytostelium subglobosum LB1 TaxID=1410327 RepID=UPI000644EB09|nr:hypothetical protein SAMD00019534_097180 [Acytostelium subglobosum LB1]GAM26543.1 hypothetical protein SAMD00019534_097180 [Acytostelium subglobosum LB1]|eukprot:XP_012750639.1 hypothetical protein SAMD00019534_097180 [Acytostelium subglobosum LB1]